MRFKDFLLNENRAYLGEKVGDILSAVHDLDEEGKGIGMRQMVRFCEKIVSLIRRILHSNWPETEHKHLKVLQKVGVAIMKGIEEKQDLRELMPSIRQELEKLSTDIGVPVNTMGPDSENAPTPETPPEEDKAKAETPPQAPPQAPGTPPGASGQMPPPPGGPAPGGP